LVLSASEDVLYRHTCELGMEGIVANGRFRVECLNAHWFMSLADAEKKLEDWRRYYNEERPHGAIGQRPPITLTSRDGVASPPP
jgi:putative transposase